MHIIRDRRALFVLAAAVLASVVLTPATAGAGDGWDVVVVPDTSVRSQPAFTFMVSGSFPECDSVDHEVFENGGGFVDPSLYTLDVDPGGESGSGTLSNDLPDTSYGLRVTCVAQQEPEFETDFLVYNRLTVQKVVDGTPPDGTTFTANVSCPPEAPFEAAGVDHDVDLDAAGGSQLVVLYERGMTCTVSEPDDGGAAEVTIDPAVNQFGIEGPYELTSVITNTFDEQTTTTTSTTTTTEPEGTEESGAAEAGVAQPTFTG